MHDKFYHEGLYRGDNALEKLSQIHLMVCGAGAVGSNLVNNLVRQGIRKITVIDFDRVEAHNVGTQTYTESDVGMFKVEALQAEMFRAVGVEITAIRQKLTERNRCLTEKSRKDLSEEADFTVRLQKRSQGPPFVLSPLRPSVRAR